MNWLLGALVGSDKKNLSNVAIYHNNQFSLDDILDVLHPLFGLYYPYNELIYTIYTVNHVFCAYDKNQNRCIACALLNDINGKEGLYIMLFGVHELAQGRGTGTQLLEAIIRWARQAGYRYITLHVHVHNYKAMGLYEKVGFVKYRLAPNHYMGLPKYPPHAYHMILTLS